MNKYISLFLMFFVLCGCNESNAKSDEKVDQLSTESSAVQARKACPDVMKYQVGDYVFGVLRRYRVNVIPLPHAFPCNEIAELKRLRYGPSQFLEYQDSAYRGQIVKFSISPMAGSQRKKYSKPADYLSDGARRIWDLEDIKMDSLPIESGFRKVSYADNHFLLIPTKEVQNTHQDLIVIGCEKSIYAPYNTGCRISFYWKDNLSVSVGFSADRFPLDEWSRVYSGAVEFLDKLEIKDIE